MRDVVTVLVESRRKKEFLESISPSKIILVSGRGDKMKVFDIQSALTNLEPFPKQKTLI